MMTRSSERIAWGLAVTGLAGAVGASAPPSFEVLGVQGTAKAVSEDGTIVTGEGLFGDSSVWQYTDDAGPMFLFDLFGKDVTGASNDGSVLVGMEFTEDPNDPSDMDLFGYLFEFEDETPFFELIIDTPRTGSTVYDVSGDGRVVVGQANRGYRDGDPTRDMPDVGPFVEEPMYFTRSEGVVTLPTLGDYPSGVPSAKVLATDGTGSIAVGEDVAPDVDDLGPGDFLAVGVVWDLAGGGSVSRIPTVPGGVGTFQPATAVSDNGRFVGGVALTRANPAPAWQPYLYDRETGELSLLGPLPDDEAFAEAGVVVPNAISNDGLRVIGTADTTDNLYDYPRGVAFIWSPSTGIRSLREALREDFDIDTGTRELRSAWDMTSDGQYVVGRATDAQSGEHAGYRVALPAPTQPCPADVTGDGVVNADDFFAFLSLFADGDARADFTGEGTINADDFFAFLSAFAAGCP